MKFKTILHSVLWLVAAYSPVHAGQSLVGKKAPDFSAPALFPDGSIHDFNLKDYQGYDVVLYFYPVDNTPGCTKQAQNFRDNIAILHAHKIVLVGISCDSIKSHINFQKQHALPYPLVSDSRWKRTISKLYGAAGFLYSKRKTFLINQQGIVVKVFDHVDIQHQINEILQAFTNA